MARERREQERRSAVRRTEDAAHVPAELSRLQNLEDGLSRMRTQLSALSRRQTTQHKQVVARLDQMNLNGAAEALREFGYVVKALLPWIRGARGVVVVAAGLVGPWAAWRFLDFAASHIHP